MDNGLIFPYRFTHDPDEPSDAKRMKLVISSEEIGGARDPNW